MYTYTHAHTISNDETRRATRACASAPAGPAGKCLITY